MEDSTVCLGSGNQSSVARKDTTHDGLHDILVGGKIDSI